MNPIVPPTASRSPTPEPVVGPIRTPRAVQHPAPYGLTPRHSGAPTGMAPRQPVPATGSSAPTSQGDAQSDAQSEIIGDAKLALVRLALARRPNEKSVPYARRLMEASRAGTLQVDNQPT